MSFRHKSEKRREWQSWLRKHRGELLACGVPLAVLEEESDWLYFLEHASFTPTGSAEPILDVDGLSEPEAEALCDFLERSDDRTDCFALRALRRRLGRGP